MNWNDYLTIGLGSNKIEFVSFVIILCVLSV
jgi:hypothetical protein